jgi:hypothetical protein
LIPLNLSAFNRYPQPSAVAFVGVGYLGVTILMQCRAEERLASLRDDGCPPDQDHARCPSRLSTLRASQRSHASDLSRHAEDAEALADRIALLARSMEIFETAPGISARGIGLEWDVGDHPQRRETEFALRNEYDLRALNSIRRVDGDLVFDAAALLLQGPVSRGVTTRTTITIATGRNMQPVGIVL